jgi:hypothetical protein
LGARFGVGFDVIETALSAAYQITDLFAIETGLIYWNYRTRFNFPPGWMNEDRIAVPLLAKFTFRPGRFSFSLFGGPYIAFSVNGRGLDPDSDPMERFTARNQPAIGGMVGGNFGYRIGPGVLFLDIRYTQDLREIDYVSTTTSSALHINDWADASIAVGYEIGLFQRRR